MRLKKKTYEGGVTLVEILVVLGILAILAFVSGTWLFSHAGRADLRRATRNLVTSLHYAKNEAIKQNTSFEVVISPGGNGWSVIQTKTGNTQQKFNTSSLRTPVNVATNKNKFVFTGKGRPTSDSWGTVTLGISSGEKLDVSVSKAGNIRVR